MTRCRHLIGITTASLGVFLLTGCIVIGGTRKSTEVQPTTGQQLVDLKRALDCGALTPDDYEVQRARVLKSCSP